MNFDEFTGEVQHCLDLSGTVETVRAIRAAVTTLGQRFEWSEFVDRVVEIEGIERQGAAAHAQLIVDLVASLVPSSNLQQRRDQLPQ